jgi:hypothetical protein
MAILIRKESSSRPSSQWRSCCQAQFVSDSQLQLAAAEDAAAAAAAAAGVVYDPALKVGAAVIC